MPKKRRVKSERTKMIEKLDRLWSLAIRTRDRFQCQKEGCPAQGRRNSQAAHIWGRGNLKTRWNLDNGITMCYYHHILWSHRQPLEFAEWIKERIGSKKYYQLRDLAHLDLKPIHLEDMQKIEPYLLNKIKEFEQRNENEPF